MSFLTTTSMFLQKSYSVYLVLLAKNLVTGETGCCVVSMQYPGDCQSRFQQWFPLDECSPADGSTVPSAFRSEWIWCFCFAEADAWVYRVTHQFCPTLPVSSYCFALHQSLAGPVCLIVAPSFPSSAFCAIQSTFKHVYRGSALIIRPKYCSFQSSIIPTDFLCADLVQHRFFGSVIFPSDLQHTSVACHLAGFHLVCVTGLKHPLFAAIQYEWPH